MSNELLAIKLTHVEKQQEMEIEAREKHEEEDKEMFGMLFDRLRAVELKQAYYAGAIAALQVLLHFWK